MVKFRSDRDWKLVFEQFDATDMSVQDYCAQNSICNSTFYSKRKKLGLAKIRDSRRKTKRPPAKIDPKFVEYKSPMSISPMQSHSITVKITNVDGRTIEVTL